MKEATPKFGRRIIVVYEPGVIHEWRSQEERIKYEINLLEEKLKQDKELLKAIRKREKEKKKRYLP